MAERADFFVDYAANGGAFFEDTMKQKSNEEYGSKVVQLREPRRVIKLPDLTNVSDYCPVCGRADPCTPCAALFRRRSTLKGETAR
jgi:hypothetical protein